MAAVLILLVVWVIPWWVAVVGIAWQGYTIATISGKIRREERRERTSGAEHPPRYCNARRQR